MFSKFIKGSPQQPVLFTDSLGAIYDRGIVFSLCAMIAVLPVSIALLDSFAVLAIFLYFLKKINHTVALWPLKAPSLSPLGKICFAYKGFFPVANTLNRPLQFLAAAIFISVLFSQYPTLSFSAFFGKFLKVVFLYFSFIEAFINERCIRIFLKFLMASAFITVLNGIVQHGTGFNYLNGRFIPVDRVNSFFNTANGLGAYLLPVIGLAAHFLFTAVRNKSWMLGTVLAFFMVLLLVCLCWTYSRGSWVGYLFILFVMAVMDRRKLLFAGALLLVFVFFFMPSLNNVRHIHLVHDNSDGKIAQDINSLLEQEGSGRINFWKKAISIIRSSPVWGTGLNTYTRIIKRDPDPKTWWYAHNCYLQTAAETGLVGLICFLWMVFVLLWHGFNCCKQMQDLWTLTFLQGTLSGLCGLLVQSFFDNTFYSVQLNMLMWVIFGLLVAVTRLNFNFQEEL